MAMDQSKTHIVRSASSARQAEVLAVSLAEHLRAAIQQRGHARIAFSGGSTPAQLFKQLSLQVLDWSKVDITLVDERCVGEDDERSNAGMLRAALINELDAEPNFFPLFIPGENEASRDARFRGFALPFDVVHLGMGEDAHTASFFPDSSNIETMLDMNQLKPRLETQSSTSQERRVTWSLPALLQSRLIVLQLIGPKKWAVLESVLETLSEGGVSDEQRYQAPVLAVLLQTQLNDSNGVPCQIYSASEF
jgi:6-phosphogluconolactonase